MMTLEEINVCNDLAYAASKGMKSKRTLKVLSNLQARGFIEYDPFAGTAKLTDEGAAALTAGRHDDQ